VEDPLVRFLSEIRSRLARLPDEERARRLDAVTNELEQSLAAELATGRDEAAAVALAIARVRRRIRWGMAGDAGAVTVNAALPPISPVSAIVLRCTVAYWIFTAVSIDLLWRLLGWLIGPIDGSLSPIRPAPPGFGGWDVRPSAIVGAIAILLLLLRDGGQRMLRDFQQRNTLSGSAVRWIALRTVFGFGLWSTFLIINRLLMHFGEMEDVPQVVYWLYGAMYATMLLVPVAPLYAGWLTSRSDPEFGLQGIKIAAAVSVILYLSDVYYVIARHLPAIDRSELIVVCAIQGCLAGLGVLGAKLAVRTAPPPSPPPSAE
jgi:hypothetical protein